MKVAIIPKSIKIQCNPDKNFNTNLYRYGNSNSQLHLERRKTTTTNHKTKIAKIILNNKRTFGRITISNLKLYYKANTWFWYRNRQVYQWNRIKGPEVNPNTYVTLIINKEAKKYSIKKKTSSICANLTGGLYV